MSEALVALAGTPEGARLAIMLALMAAVAHAAFGALQKGRHDPWQSRGAIDLFVCLLSAPIALFVVPWPQGNEWAILGVAAVIHLVYKLTMAFAYERAPYTVVYPVVRGSGPLVTLAFAAVFLAEHYGPLQWLGVGLLSGAILLLSRVNLRGATTSPQAMRAGLVWALAGGAMVAVYTTFDAWGIRQTADPFTFLAWFFLLTAFDFPLLVLWRHARGIGAPIPADPRGLLIRGLIGGLVAFVSFGGVMLATRLGKVGEAAALRETSTLFAALIGWAFLGEKVGPVRAILMGAIALGAILVQAG